MHHAPCTYRLDDKPVSSCPRLPPHLVHGRLQWSSQAMVVGTSSYKYTSTSPSVFYVGWKVMALPSPVVNVLIKR